MNFKPTEAAWLNPPQTCVIEEARAAITTDPETDFWQRTYYGFQNDNAHLLYWATDEPYFSFTVKAEFNSSALFDQCGLAIYQDSDHWAKAGIEYHDRDTAWLGSVVTNRGYSDWATTDIGARVTCMWYRLSRRGSDYCFEHSADGLQFKQMRIFHLFEADREVRFGLFACSPSRHSFQAVFTEMRMTECLWKAHP